jgi:hypothetical protein
MMHTVFHVLIPSIEKIAAHLPAGPWRKLRSVRDKNLEEVTYTDEAGEQRCLPVEASRALATRSAGYLIRWADCRTLPRFVCPFFTLLCGTFPGHIFFVVWDIARAFLGLAETARGVTEDMVARTESFMTCLLAAAFESVVNPAMFDWTISFDRFKRLEPGRYSAGDAVSFVMASMTLAMGRAC